MDFSAWRANPRQMGELIYARLPQEARPKWAAEVLATCSAELPSVPAAVTRVISMGRSRWSSRWRSGHAAFHAIRRLTLQSQQQLDHDTAGLILYVGENAAKVIYNASNPDAPFDEDAGAWLVECAHQFATRVADGEFFDRLWAVLSQHTSP